MNVITKLDVTFATGKRNQIPPPTEGPPKRRAGRSPQWPSWPVTTLGGELIDHLRQSGSKGLDLMVYGAVAGADATLVALRRWPLVRRKALDHASAVAPAGDARDYRSRRCQIADH
jgi:hypothetical protein